MKTGRHLRRRPRGAALAAMIGLMALLPGFSAIAAPPRQDPEPTATSFGRPILVLKSYFTEGTIKPGEQFTLDFRLANEGEVKARNITATFTSGDFLPRSRGGVVSAGTIDAGASTGYEIKMAVSSDLASGAIGSLEMFVTYTDPVGTSYDQSFTLAIPLVKVKPGPIRPTSTPTAIVRPQLLIVGYQTDVTPLQPGVRFTLNMEIHNVGGGRGRGVSMIIGGGSQTTSGGTPVPGSSGGVSGAAGDFATFAPVGTSNIQFLGDFDASSQVSLEQALIVNSTAKPGAYALKISFVYRDESNVDYTDDQVITLLVYQPPVVEVSFYRPPDPFQIGGGGTLPIQVVNLGRSSVVLGRMTVASESGELANGVATVGLIDSGGYFTLDAMFTPALAGRQDVRVRIDYLDDFNEAKQIEQALSIEVTEALQEGVGGGGGGGSDGEVAAPVSAPETMFQRLWRGFLGLIGLDSGAPQPAGEPMPVAPSESVPYRSSGPKG
jgi:hypothetical protein